MPWRTNDCLQKYFDWTGEWNPHTTYNWTNKTIKMWLLEFGEYAYYNGEQWSLKKKSLGAGVYKVWFEPFNAKA